MTPTETTSQEQWQKLLAKNKSIREELAKRQASPQNSKEFAANLQTLRQNAQWTTATDQLLIKWAEAVVKQSTEDEAQTLLEELQKNRLRLCNEDLETWTKKGLRPFPKLLQTVCTQILVATDINSEPELSSIAKASRKDTAMAKALMEAFVQKYEELPSYTVGRDNLRSGIRWFARETKVEIPPKFLAAIL